jgi:hypothetical protein
MHARLAGRRPGPTRLVVRQVLFGYRVRAEDEDQVWLDYCCGDEPGVIELIFALTRRALGARQANDMPRQVVKPVWNDRRFLVQLAEAAGEPPSTVLAAFAAYPPDRMDALDEHGRLVGPAR